MKNDYWKLIFDNPIVGFAYSRIVLDDEGKPVDFVFLELNETLEKMTGLSRKDLISKLGSELIPEVKRGSPNMIDVYGKVALENATYVYEEYSQTLKKWYRTYVFSPEKYDFASLSIDVTGQKESADLVKQYTFAIEQSPASIVLTDADANIIHVNKRFTDITGYTKEEVVGKNPRVLQSGEHSKEFYKNLWKILVSGKVWSGQFRNKRKNGELFWEEATIAPVLNEKGEVVNYLALKEDVTKKRLVERQIHKLSKVVEQSPNMILITNLDFVIEFVNDSFVKISGYSAKEIVGKQFKLLKLAKANEEEYKEFWKILNSGQVWSGERIDKRKNGELYWQLVFVNPVFDEYNKIVNYVATIQDISDRKKVEERIQELNLNLEQKVVERTSELSITNEFLMREMINRKKNEAELKRARDEAEKSNRAKSEFISRMSHELRTPMNSILGFAQLFSMGTLTETQRKGVEHILNSGKHLLRLINEVLDISKIESGKFSMSVEEVNVNESILEAIDLVHPLTTLPQVTVQYETRNQDELYVRADKQRLIQILVNILNNAIKYNKQGGTVTVTTKYEKTAEGIDDNVIIGIHDTGIGIAEEDLEKLFVPFERSGNLKTQIEGTGLGLSIAKELVNLLQGEIYVESEIDVGSSFYVKLPHVRYVKRKIAKPLPSDTSGKDVATPTGTVLYIEDNYSNIELIEQIFTVHRPNLSLILHKSGNDVVDLVLKHEPYLILLDLDLPHVHGSKIVKSLKENEQTRHIPIVIISADAMNHQIRRMIRLGVNSYLTKPIDVQEFLAEIDKY